MSTLYVYALELMTDEHDYTDATYVAEIEADTDADALAQFEDRYGSNDYVASFTMRG